MKRLFKKPWFWAIICFTAGILAMISMPAPALDYPSLYSPSGEFMGEVSDDDLRRDSISNELGRYGSDISPDSIHNDMSRFGSEYSSESPFYIGRPGSLEREDFIPDRSYPKSRIREERRR